MGAVERAVDMRSFKEWRASLSARRMPADRPASATVARSRLRRHTRSPGTYLRPHCGLCQSSPLSSVISPRSIWLRAPLPRTALPWCVLLTGVCLPQCVCVISPSTATFRDGIVRSSDPRADRTRSRNPSQKKFAVRGRGGKRARGSRACRSSELEQGGGARYENVAVRARGPGSRRAVPEPGAPRGPGARDTVTRSRFKPTVPTPIHRLHASAVRYRYRARMSAYARVGCPPAARAGCRSQRLRSARGPRSGRTGFTGIVCVSSEGFSRRGAPGRGHGAWPGVHYRYSPTVTHLPVTYR